MLLVPGLAFTTLATSCQSSRPAFSFQPTPQLIAAVDVSVRTALVDSVSVVAEVSSAPNADALIHKPQKRQPATKLGMALHSVVAMPQLARRPLLAHRRALLNRSHDTADAGFGLTVLGLLGLIGVVVGLVGLILSGGSLGWIIVLGASALAVLIAYIDPHGR
jgi:hypothetical protein